MSVFLKNINYYSSPRKWDNRLSSRFAPRYAKRWARLNEYLDFESIQELRWQRLKNIIEHAYHNVPLYTKLYKKMDVSLSDVRSEESMHMIPIVTKVNFKEHIEDEGYFAKNVDSKRRKLSSTSGSTGQPLQYSRDRDYSSELFTLGTRVWRWAGVDAMAPKIYCSMVGGRHFAPNTIFLHPHFLQRKSKEYINIIRASGAKLLFGEPYTTLDLLKMLDQEHVNDIRFEKAVLWGYVLSTPLRSLFRDNFGCEVFNLYGSGEIGAIAAECDIHDGLHIHEENVIVEIVDENACQLPPGVIGRIVLTSLSNEVMPFIRYDLGDRGMFILGICACGRKFRRILVEGRDGESLFQMSNGESISPGVLRDILDRYFLYIRRYQVKQTGFDTFILKLVTTDIFTRSLEEEIISKIKNSVQYPITITITYTDSISLHPNHKFMPFTSIYWGSHHAAS